MKTSRKETLRANLERVRKRIEEACRRGGRDADGITLVAVTKLVDAETAGQLLDLGVEHIGENRVAEAERKRSVIREKGTWHMVGHLQRNKVKKALRLFSMIHSVDSSRLMQEISAQGVKSGVILDILLEVNVSGEASKYGLEPKKVPEAVDEALCLPGLVLRGLMTLAPFSDDPEDARPHFRELKKLFDAVREQAGDRFNVLSMGMTGDFETAVEEGATHVRVGTALFQGLD
jgi:pyridoxal phosphate enzyme (YggS family)